MKMRLVLVSVAIASGLALSGCAELGLEGPGRERPAMGGEHQMGERGEGHRMNGDMESMHSSMHDVEADAAAVTAVLQAYSDAINAEDIDAMAAQVVADERFSVIEGSGTNVGWADYRDHHIGPEFASERIDFHVYGYHDIDVRVGHMFSYATFTYAFEATLDGEPYNKEGRGTAVLMRTQDGWRIRHLQTS